MFGSSGMFVNSSALQSFKPQPPHLLIYCQSNHNIIGIFLVFLCEQILTTDATPCRVFLTRILVGDHVSQSRLSFRVQLRVGGWVTLAGGRHASKGFSVPTILRAQGRAV